MLVRPLFAIPIQDNVLKRLIQIANLVRKMVIVMTVFSATDRKPVPAVFVMDPVIRARVVLVMKTRSDVGGDVNLTKNAQTMMLVMVKKLAKRMVSAVPALL